MGIITDKRWPLKFPILWVSLFIVLCLGAILPGTSYTVYAESISGEDSVDVFEGHGTRMDPYEITSYQDICLLRDLVNGGESFAGVCFQQTTDLVFPGEENWQPIGDLEKEFAFSGCYDGDGHTISNIHSDATWAGLFMYLDGEVRNLGIESGTFTGACAGSITSHGTTNAKIINCYNKASITGSSRAGGIADNCPGTIAFCWNFGPVSGTDENVTTAGICSYGNASISYCYAVGADQLTDPQNFSGTVTDSFLVSPQEMDEYLPQMYQGMWDNYQNGTPALISEDFTVFMKQDAESLLFDRNYVPEPFCSEKENNKAEFLAVCEQKFSFEGEGTKESPFLISSFDDLVRLRDCVDVGITYSGICFQQTADIYFPDGENWNPIGDAGFSIGFEGIYDGCGHSIYNIYCEDTFAGFFSLLNGEVRNLGIESGCFTGDTCGSITSHGGQNGKILNCYNKADVTGGVRVGGLTDNFNGQILFSWNLGTVTGKGENTVVAGICSYGFPHIEYSYSVGGDRIVAPSTFSGTEVASHVISASDLESTLNQNHCSYDAYFEDGVFAPQDLVYMTVTDGQLSYDPNFVPQILQRNAVLFWLPAAVIFAIGIVFCLIALCTLKPWKQKEQSADATPTDDVVKASARPRIDKVVLFHRVRSIAVVGIVIILPFTIINATLSNKNIDGITTMQDFYRQPKGCVDVLLVGSSKVGINIDGSVLWNEYGISTYNLWGSLQPFWNSYYYLEEAFRVNKPKVVILDAVAASRAIEYSPNYQKITNTLAIRDLGIKAKAVAATCEPEERLEFLLGFPLYHNRYAELSKNDFMHYPWTAGLENDKGFKVVYGSYEEERTGPYNTNAYKALPSKEEYYLNRIIALCKEEGVELVLVKTQELSCDESVYNTMALIAEENQVPFINFDELNDELDFTVDDFQEDMQHLTFSGAKKNSTYLGKFLKDNFDLEDHRGDARYHSWDLMASEIQNTYLRKIEATDEYFEELSQDNKTVLVLPYRMEGADPVQYQSFLDALNTVSHDWVDRADECYGQDNEINLPFGKNPVRIEKEYRQLTVEVNEKKIEITTPGYLVLVYDGTNDEVVDVCMFIKDEDVVPEHLYNVETTKEESENDSE